MLTSQKRKRLKGELLWVVMGTLLTMIGGLLTIKILSNLLSVEDFGRYALLFSLVSFLVAVLFTPLGQVTLRFAIIAQNDGGLGSYIALQNRVFAVISALSMLALGLAGLWFGMAGFLAMLALALAMGLQVVQQYLLMAFRQRRQNAIAQLVGAVARPLLVFLAIYFVQNDEISAVYGLALGFFAIAGVQYFYLASLPATRGRLSFGGAEMARYGGTYFLIGLVTITVFIADRWVLSAMGSLEQVAIFAALMQVALAPVAFSHAVLTRLAAPIFFAADGVQQPRQFRQLLLVWGGLCALVLMVTAAFPVLIVALLTNAQYAQYAYLMPWMVLGLILERTAQILEMKGSLRLKTSGYRLPRLLVVVLVPTLEMLAFYLWGFNGLVAGLVMGTFIGVLGAASVNRNI